MLDWLVNKKKNVLEECVDFKNNFKMPFQIRSIKRLSDFIDYWLGFSSALKPIQKEWHQSKAYIYVCMYTHHAQFKQFENA